MATDARRGLLLAAAGTLAFSACGPMVRAASPRCSAEALVFLRMAASALLVFALARARGGARRLPVRLEAEIAGVGLVAFLHFSLFMASLYHTTVARSLALNYLSPVFTFLATLAAGGPRRARDLAAKSLCLAGAVGGTLLLVTRGDPSALAASVNGGDLCALGGGVTLSAYHLWGARLRPRVGALDYAFRVYAFAALPFLPIFLLAPGRFAVTPSADFALLLAGLVILPTAVGHTLVNAALAYAPAPLVSLVTTQEVGGGTLVAAIALGETPSRAELAGLVLSLAFLAGFYVIDLRAGGAAGRPAEAPSGPPASAAGRRP